MNEIIPSESENQTLETMAKRAFKSKFFDKLGGEDAIYSMMLFARELNLPPLQCLFGGMNCIQGKVELSPRLMNTMIRKAGHKIEIKESSDLKCVLVGTRKDSGERYEACFTLDEAKRAGLVRSGGGWEKYASDMLFARALSRLARRLFADVISTAYIEGEISNPEGFPEKKAKEPEIVEQVVEIVKEDVKEEFIDPNQEHHIMDLISGDTEMLATLLDAFGIESLDKLPAKKFAGTCRRLSELKKTKEAAECKS